MTYAPATVAGTPRSDPAASGLAPAHRAAMTRQLPRFAVCWLGTTAMWQAAFVAEAILTPLPAFAMLVLEGGVLLVAVAICKANPRHRRVRLVLIVTCVLLGICSTALFAMVRGDGDVSAFVLLTLYLSSALFFRWGWWSELVVLVATVIPWLAAIPFLVFYVPTVELATAIAIGSVLALAVAEGAAQTFRAAFLHQASEERHRQALEAARDEAEAASHAKDQFLATLSHELRSPLSAVLTWTHILRRGLVDASRTDHALSVIERNARRQIRLVEDLLDVARIVSGKLSVEMSSIDLRDVLRGVMEALRAAAESKRITVEIELPPQPIPVRGDYTRLQQVVDNLLSNAIKFTPEGGRVDLAARVVGARAEITVRDSGIGMSANVLARVFERFHQADNSIARKHGGLGLGLTIARHLVELHGGVIGAESEGDCQGATFRVQLPLDTAGHSTVEHRRAPGAGALPTLAGLRVMVVDDEADARDFVSNLLARCGAAVTPAASVQDALKELAERLPDVLVADLAMPEEDGYALIRKVRVLERGRPTRLRAIALTALASSEDRARAIQAGFDLHLTKPVEPEDVVVAVARSAASAVDLNPAGFDNSGAYDLGRPT